MPHPLLRHGRAQFASILAHGVVLGAAAAFAARDAWLYAFGGMLALNLWMWQRSLRHGWAIRDTPTSRVASAAQGYVELYGRAEAHDAVQVQSPMTRLPCLWYHYLRERRDRAGKWRYADSGESDAPFTLDDGSGRCVVEPRGAHIHSKHRERRTEGDWRYTERVILKGDMLYAIGAFSSERAGQTLPPARIAEGELLAEWKADAETLRARFDLDGDGDIDAREWALARAAARREVARRHDALRARGATHHLRRPADGRPYVIANQPPEELARGYLRWALLHLALLCANLAGLAWAWRLA